MSTPLFNLCLGRLTSARCQRDLGPGPDRGHRGSGFCADCYYEGIEEEYERYKELRSDGVSAKQAAVEVGWDDPG